VGEPGKGGFWALDPEYISVFESGTFKGTGRRVPIRKRHNPPSGPHKPTKMNTSSSSTGSGGAVVGEATERRRAPTLASALSRARSPLQNSPEVVFKPDVDDEDLGLVEVLGDRGDAVHGIGICTDPNPQRKDVLKSRCNISLNTSTTVKRRRTDSPLSVLPSNAGTAFDNSENVFDYGFLEELCGADQSSVVTDCISAVEGFTAWPSDDLFTPTVDLDRVHSGAHHDQDGVLDQSQLFDYPLTVADDFMLSPIMASEFHLRSTSPLISI
jgi:hypothetical protein